MSDENGGPVKLTEEMLRALLPEIARLGIAVPGFERLAPHIDLTQPIRALALECGRLLSPRNIFLKGSDVVTVDEQSGELTRMTARRFCTYVEDFTAFKAEGARQKRPSLTAEDAGLILDSDIFRSCLRPLNAVHKMRLPVLRKTVPQRVEFLAPGYDRETGIFTVDLLKYDMTWTLDRATTFLDDHGSEYPFTWPDDRPAVIASNRNWSVQVAAMLGVFCQAMFEPGTTRPMIIYVGNKPGTGKGTLAAMALIPVFGTAATTSIPKDEERLISTLETVARTRRPYAFFDDVPGGIFSTALYGFVTSRAHSGRVMGANAEFFEEPNVTQVFATGIDMKFDANLRRRALVVELFLATDVRGREFRRVITLAYLAREDVRTQFLSALCAIVRHYADTAFSAALLPLPEVRPLESFEHWTQTIATMVQLAGYADPLAMADLAGAGAIDDDEMKELLIAVASSAERSCVFTRKELVEKARELALLESIVGVAGDPDPDATATKKWGKRLQRCRGQEYRDNRGRLFRFSSRKQKTGAAYPLTFLEPIFA